jgi:hypothetical protein
VAADRSGIKPTAIGESLLATIAPTSPSISSLVKSPHSANSVFQKTSVVGSGIAKDKRTPGDGVPTAELALLEFVDILLVFFLHFSKNCACFFSPVRRSEACQCQTNTTNNNNNNNNKEATRSAWTQPASAKRKQKIEKSKEKKKNQSNFTFECLFASFFLKESVLHLVLFVRDNGRSLPRRSFIARQTEIIERKTKKFLFLLSVDDAGAV